MSSVLGPLLSNAAFKPFSAWVDPGVNANVTNHVDFISYLYNNYPDSERSPDTLRIFSEYQEAVREIAVAESALVTLSSNQARTQISKEEFPENTNDSYTSINKNILDAAEYAQTTRLREFEANHLQLRLRKVNLEVKLLEQEVSGVERRLVDRTSTARLYNPSLAEPIRIPDDLLQTKSNLAHIFSMVEAFPAVNPNNAKNLGQPQVVDVRARAPSLSHSVSTVTSFTPSTPHNSPRHPKVRKTATPKPARQANTSDGDDAC